MMVITPAPLLPLCDCCPALTHTHGWPVSSGLCLGATASVCQSQLPGCVQLHGTLLAVGPVGIQCGAAKLASGGLTGDAGR